MMIIDTVIVPDDFLQARFVCDLPRCKGNCCVLGDAGAPLTVAEIDELQDQLEAILPFMTENGRRTVLQQGVFDYDENGNYTTPLIDGRECAFTGFHDNGVSYCTIEKAFEGGKSTFRKPVSCHLYPVRLTESSGFVTIHYHRWSICVPAIRKGEKAGVPLYVFLKDALVRQFGAPWYAKLEAAIQKAAKGSQKK